METKVGEKLTFEDEEFFCIGRGRGINATHVCDYNPRYAQDKCKIKHFIKNSSGYKIYFSYETIKVKVFETCIDFFGSLEFDETKRAAYLCFMENLYNEFNEKHQLNSQQSLYNFK